MSSSDRRKRIALLALGSEIIPEDDAGIRVAREVRRLIPTHRFPDRRIRVFEGHTAPENLTGAIRRFHPSHVVLIDAVSDGDGVSPVRVIPKEAITGITCSTHTLPVTLLADYCERSMGCRTTVIGVTPSATDVHDLAKRVLRLCRAI